MHLVRLKANQVKKRCCKLFCLFTVLYALNGSIFQVTAAANPVSVKIERAPVGASVLVDNRSVGNTPVSITLEDGVHTIRISQPGYADWSQTYAIYGNPISIYAALNGKM